MEATSPSGFSIGKSTVYPGETVNCTWNPSTGDFDGYNLEAFEAGLLPYGSEKQTFILGKVTSYSVTIPTTATVGNHIQFAIWAIKDGAGASSADGVYPEIVSAPGVAPPFPTYITVGEAAQGEAVDIAWGSVSGASYVLERSVNGGTFASVYTGSSISYTDTAGSTWQTVQYRVKAVVSGASSDWTVSAVKTVQAPEPPEQPTTPAAGRLEQFQNRNGTNIYPRTVIEGIFRQNDGKPLSEIVANAAANIDFYVDPVDGHLYKTDG